MGVPTCPNCRWYVEHVFYGRDCSNPQAATLNPVTGRTPCWEERSAMPFSKRCGPKGRLFEAKATGQ